MKDLLEQAAKRAQELFEPTRYIYCHPDMVDEIKQAVTGRGIKVVGSPYIDKTTAYIVNAVRYEGGVIHPMDGWVKNAFDNEVLWWDSWMQLYVRTLEGYMHVSNGDYIIKGIDGELYPCKPDIFEKTYEKVEK